MARQNTAIVAFNRGRISPRALARADLRLIGSIERVALSAEVMTNWVTGIFGNMMLRPGFRYISGTHLNRKAIHLNFVFSLSDQAELELTDSVMRVRINDTIVERPSVTTTIANSGFDSDLASWVDEDEAGASSDWVAGGFLGLTGAGGNSAIRTQIVSVTGGNLNVEHGIRIVVARGEVTFKIGSTAGGDEYVPETTLGVGTFSFAVTPTTNMNITISASTNYQSLVDSVTIEQSGILTIPTPWSEADLPLIRHDQSGDVIFVACKGKPQYRIERRATRSWGIVEYLAKDGPFLPINTTSTTIASSAITGNVTLTASKGVFRATNVGGLYRITSTGQAVSSNISAQNVFTGSVRVTGVGGSRAFVLTISGTWTAVVTLQRSIGEEGAWEDVANYSSNTSISFNDALDNQIIFYRLGIKTGNYTSGTAVCSLNYALGSNAGVVRVTEYVSPTVVNGIVLEDLGGAAGSSDWEEGIWSPRRGYPTAVAIDESRLWWAGGDRVFGSVTDAFDSFDDTVEGDSGPIVRSLGSGPVDNINWLMALARLVAGAETSEKVFRSSSLDEPLSPTVFNVRSPSSRGSSPVPPVRVDSTGFFVRGGRLFELEYYQETLDYQANDLTALCPEIMNGFDIVRIAVQRLPDTRIHCVGADGRVALFSFDRAENMRCWVNIVTQGEVEDVLVKPAAAGETEDSVYYLVRRISGFNVRCWEKWARESECVGDLFNNQADSFVTGTTVGDGNVISGLGHLNGFNVVVWADGKNFSPIDANGVQTTYAVSGGQITLPESVVNYVVGLPYQARYVSTRLAYAAQGGTALVQKGKIDRIGVIARNMHYRGLRYGNDKTFLRLYDLPQVERGQDLASTLPPAGLGDYVWDEYDEMAFEFEPEYDTDSRVCLQANAPMPCELLALAFTMQKNERV